MKTLLKQINILLLIVLLGICNLELCAQNISGRVLCKGKGIKNVVVTDGVHFALTDSKGNYNLPLSYDASFVYITTPTGYLPQRKNSIPLFYQSVETSKKKEYNFELVKNTRDDMKHTFMLHSDAQLFKEKHLEPYNVIMDDCAAFIQQNNNHDIFTIDCGDLVGDKPELYPACISSDDKLNIPFYRVLGNHDMSLYGRSDETSVKQFEGLFGPSYYSFNRGKVHYVILDDVFYLGRDHAYTGYLTEKQLAWLEKDLSYIEKGSLVFIAMHIPTRLEVDQTAFEYSGANLTGRVSNAAFLYKMLEPFRVHLLTGHTHYNRNLEHSENLFEHITASMCGTWWEVSYCVEGTPQGYGVYEVDGDHVKWYFKSAGFPKEYQLRAYAPGTVSEYPDDVTACVWNYDARWKVEWLEDGQVMGEMEQTKICDPGTVVLCADKDKLEFKWISAIPSDHMFRATVNNKNARIEVRATDRFGNIFQAAVEK